MNFHDKSNFNSLLIEIFNKVPENIYCLGLDGKLIFCNTNQLKVFGLESSSELVGMDIFDVGKMLGWPKNIPEKIREHDLTVMNTRKKSTQEEVVELDGKKHYFLAKKSPWLDEKLNLLGIIGVSIDITEKKELEESKIKQEELEKKSHYTKLAAGSIAHDLRTPLLSIQSAMMGIEKYLPILVDGYKKAQESELEVECIPNSRLENLSTVSKRCTSEIYFSNHYIDLILGNLNSDEINTDDYSVHTIKNLVKDSVSSYPRYNEKSQLIHLRIENDFKFLGNEIYLKNMMNNLLKNALFYIAQSGRGEIFIETQLCQEDAGFNHLVFKDTAKGAPPEVVKNMFDGFYSKREGGTGLGLSFCKNIMKSFGGDIQASSVENEYMEFVLKFPKLS